MRCVVIRIVFLLLGMNLVCPSWAVGEDPIPEATNLWVAALPAVAFGSAPTLAVDGTIYQGTFNGTLVAFTPNGEMVWKFKAGREIASTPAIADDGTIYFGCRDGKLYAVTSAGKLKWTFATSAWVDSSPAIAGDGTIYFGGWDHWFYALNPDGSLKWKYAAGAIVDSSPAIAADGTIYFGSHDKKLYALDPEGKVRWSYRTQGAIISSPAIGPDRNIYFSSLDGNLYRLDAAGKLVWSFHFQSWTQSSPILGNSDEVCIGHSVGLNSDVAVVTTNGAEHWHSGSAVPMDLSQVAVADHFYFSLPWRTMQSVTAVDHRLWKVDLDENVTASLTLGPDGTIYAVCGMKLYAIRPPGPALPPAKSSWPMFHANARHTGRVAEKL
jgi:outer membrane protein assembly factor BamB